jgi:glyoxylase-like metal-dependent hydrolase (beta-lactamase superfamily II)
MARLKVAERWFERRAMPDGVTWLWEPHLDPFIRCNIWHVRGRDRDLIIDTGSGLSPLRIAIADLADKPVAAVATHIHYDHVGGLHEFDIRLMHRIEAPRMNPYREFHPIRASEFPGSFREYLAARDPARDDLLLDALPVADWKAEDYRIESVTPTRQLDAGDVVDLGDRALEVLHLPGHSPGSIGLWEPRSGILFSGDAIYDGPLLDMLPDSSVQDYLSTMKRLRSLPVTIVHGGHEPSFGRERMVALADAYLSSRGA